MDHDTLWKDLPLTFAGWFVTARSRGGSEMMPEVVKEAASRLVTLPDQFSTEMKMIVSQSL